MGWANIGIGIIKQFDWIVFMKMKTSEQTDCRSIYANLRDWVLHFSHHPSKEKNGKLLQFPVPYFLYGWAHLPSGWTMQERYTQPYQLVLGYIDRLMDKPFSSSQLPMENTTKCEQTKTANDQLTKTFSQVFPLDWVTFLLFCHHILLTPFRMGLFSWSSIAKCASLRWVCWRGEAKVRHKVSWKVGQLLNKALDWSVDPCQVFFHPWWPWSDGLRCPHISEVRRKNINCSSEPLLPEPNHLQPLGWLVGSQVGNGIVGGCSSDDGCGGYEWLMCPQS